MINLKENFHCMPMKKKSNPYPAKHMIKPPPPPSPPEKRMINEDVKFSEIVSFLERLLRGEFVNFNEKS